MTDETRAEKLERIRTGVKINAITELAAERDMISPGLAAKLIDLDRLEVGPQESVIGLKKAMDDLAGRHPELFRARKRQAASPPRLADPPKRLKLDAVKNPALLRRPGGRM